MSGPFAVVDEADAILDAFIRDLDPDRLSAAVAADGIDQVGRLERRLAGVRILLAKRIDESVVGDDGEGSRARWLAKHTGQSPHDADKDLETSEALDGLDATDEALRNGELSPTQAHEVSSAATEDPTAESDLLGTAKNASVPELRRKAKKIRAAATDDEQKARRAHENRDLSSGTDEDLGEGWIHAKGPTVSVAELLALLEPWVQAEFDRARREGRHQRRGAYAFDALLTALRFAAAGRQGPGNGQGPEPAAPVGPPAAILARVDIAAFLRGRTVAGETCEIDGFGPVPVEALRALLPQAAIDLIVTDGVDVFNVTHFGRRATARQQVVLDWIGGQCTRLGCPATRHLQVDHRIDWAHVKITELRSLDWLCPQDHRRKTHQGWALVAGTGKRRMVPPGHPAHPRSTADPPGDPPRTAAA
jgi:hypothetical protein